MEGGKVNHGKGRAGVLVSHGGVCVVGIQHRSYRAPASNRVSTTTPLALKRLPKTALLLQRMSQAWLELPWSQVQLHKRVPVQQWSSQN